MSAISDRISQLSSAVGVYGTNGTISTAINAATGLSVDNQTNLDNAHASRLEESLAAKVEAEETKRDGKPGEQTAVAVNGVIWFAIFAKDYTKALSVADHAHALFPDNLGIETNRAHALMFIGRDEEPKTLYLAHKKEPVSGEISKLWEQVIADDFAAFRKAGLTNPMMADIEKELGISR